ncbi:PREDICTED: golgin subfamily A member 8K-like, partial [Rhinopithecus bieti]|uniref:golgin subfamily A member 8K-like n=1 Tax=Rhinopithecus bieti TaxID=61621 RepID=UPI00083C2F32
ELQTFLLGSSNGIFLLENSRSLDIQSATGIDGEGPTSSAPLKDLESPCQELPAALHSRSVKINQLNNIIKSLKQQKKQVEHQLEEEKKANNKKQKAERELEVQIQRLNRQIKKLNMDTYHTERSLRYFKEESKDLSGRLQHTVQRIGELEQALSAVPATQEEKEISVSSTTCPVPWEPSFTDGGVSLKVPSAGWSVLPRRHHGHFSLLFVWLLEAAWG